MQIERISYKRRYDSLVEHKKEVFTEIDDHHFLRQSYQIVDGQWMDSGTTSYFNGEKVINGMLVTVTVDTVKEKFALLMKYEGFKEVSEQKSFTLSICGVDAEIIKKKKDRFVYEMVKAYPTADTDVLYFIADFLYHNNPTDEGAEFLRLQFRSGYCYHFANILKSTFMRGEVVWCAPFGHFAWKDMDGQVYDVEGIYQGEAEYFIPESYVGEAINDFLHVRNHTFNATKEHIEGIITEYLKDFKE